MGKEQNQKETDCTIVKGCMEELLTRMAGADDGWLDCSSAAQTAKEAADRTLH